MKARNYLEKFPRWNELSQEITDKQARIYVTNGMRTIDYILWKILTLGSLCNLKKLLQQQDIEGCAKLLHEKEEINELRKFNYSIDYIVNKGSTGKGVKEEQWNEAHDVAMQTEIQFLKFLSKKLGFDEDFGIILATTFPSYFLRHPFSKFKIFSACYHNIPGKKITPSLEEVKKAVNIQKAFGAKFKYAPEEIYSIIQRSGPYL